MKLSAILLASLGLLTGQAYGSYLWDSEPPPPEQYNQPGPFMCGSFRPNPPCEVDGSPNEAYKNSLFLDGYILNDIFDYYDYYPNRDEATSLTISRTLLFSDRYPQSPPNIVTAECDAFCAKVAYCPEGWAVGEDYTCYELQKGPYDCEDPSHPWVSPDWGNGLVCDADTGALNQGALNLMYDEGWAYDRRVKNFSYVEELPWEMPPTSYQMLVVEHQWVYRDDPNATHIVQCTKQCPQMYECPPGYALDSMRQCSPMICDEGTVLVGRECVVDTGEEDPVIVDDPIIDDPVIEDPIIEDPVIEDPVNNVTIASNGTRQNDPRTAMTSLGQQVRELGDSSSEYGSVVFRDGNSFGYSDLIPGGFDALTADEVAAEMAAIKSLGYKPFAYVQVYPAGGSIEASQVDYDRGRRLADLTGIRSFYIYTGQDAVVRHRTAKPVTSGGN